MRIVCYSLIHAKLRQFQRKLAGGPGWIRIPSLALTWYANHVPVHLLLSQLSIQGGRGGGLSKSRQGKTSRYFEPIKWPEITAEGHKMIENSCSCGHKLGYPALSTLRGHFRGREDRLSTRRSKVEIIVGKGLSPHGKAWI